MGSLKHEMDTYFSHVAVQDSKPCWDCTCCCTAIDLSVCQDGRIAPHILQVQVKTGCITFIVHVGWHLNHAEAEVDGQVIKMIVGFQEKLSSQLHAIPILIHLVYQHCVKILILQKKNEKNKSMLRSYSRSQCQLIKKTIQI